MKKGQMEIGITVIVLLVFFIILAISLVVYYQLSWSSIVESKEKILEQRFSSFLVYLTNLPELKCVQEKDCLDVIKLQVFDGDNIYYKKIFGGEVNKIYVDAIYPNEERFVLYSKSDNGLIYSTPVSLYYPKQDRYVIGKLSIVVAS